MTLRDEINKAVQDAGIEGFRFLNLHSHAPLLEQIADRFLAHGRSDLRSIWLWERFKKPVCTLALPDAITFLARRLSRTSSYWFLASDEDGKYWVAETTGEAVIHVLQETRCFEYYIVDRTLQWILCENHHGLLIEAGKRGLLEREQGAPADGSRG
jgi:hypothetical protein